MTADQLDDLEALIRAVIQKDAADLLPYTNAGRSCRMQADDNLLYVRETILAMKKEY